MPSYVARPHVLAGWSIPCHNQANPLPTNDTPASDIPRRFQCPAMLGDGGVGMGQKEMATTAAGKNRDHDLRPESRWHSSQTLTSALCPLSSRRLKSRCHNRGSKGGGDAGARPPNARAGTAVAAVRPETTSGGTIARRCISARPPKWTGGLNRERDAVKRRSGADQVRPSA
jgi:hypothetical protein